MIIGVPKEIKNNEFRVGLTPSAAKAYIDYGHNVYIQNGAGVGSGFSNEDYISVGVDIVQTIEEVYKFSDMIIKVKEPLPSEYPLLRENQIIFTYFHFAANRELLLTCLEKKIIGIAYETIKDREGRLTCLIGMSKIAGKLAVFEGAKYLQKIYGGRGVLLSGIDGQGQGKVVVLGAAGTAGLNAVDVAMHLGLRVTAIDSNQTGLSRLAAIYGSRIELLVSTPNNILDSLLDADLVISTVLVTGDQAPRLIKKEYLRKMQPGAVIVDVAIDQGGSTETSHPTTHDKPIYIVDGIIHYCVANMPSAVPHTASIVLSESTLPYGLKIANLGYRQAMALDSGLLEGLNVENGRVMYGPLKVLFNL